MASSVLIDGYYFTLMNYPNGNPSLLLDGFAVTNEAPVLLFSRVENGVIVSENCLGYVSKALLENNNVSYHGFFGVDDFVSIEVSFNTSLQIPFLFDISQSSSFECFVKIDLSFFQLIFNDLNFLINVPSMGSTVGGFSVPSLNGNCGSLLDGTVVTVTGLEGDFNVVASQFVWNDSTAQMSMIMYNLSKDGKFCLVPDVYVSAKAS